MQETHYLKDQDHLIEKLKNIPFLRSFDERLLKEILNASKIRKYEPGETIISEGSYDTWIYVIIAGEVKVVKKEEEISRLGKVGDIFGELAVIDGQARSASVHAVTKITCLGMDASCLNKMNSDDKNLFYLIFYRLLSEVLAGRLRTTSDELTRVKEKLESLENFVEKKWY